MIDTSQRFFFYARVDIVQFRNVKQIIVSWLSVLLVKLRLIFSNYINDENKVANLKECYSTHIFNLRILNKFVSYASPYARISLFQWSYKKNFRLHCTCSDCFSFKLLIAVSLFCYPTFKESDRTLFWKLITSFLHYESTAAVNLRRHKVWRTE